MAQLGTNPKRQNIALESLSSAQLSPFLTAFSWNWTALAVLITGKESDVLLIAAWHSSANGSSGNRHQQSKPHPWEQTFLAPAQSTGCVTLQHIWRILSQPNAKHFKYLAKDIHKYHLKKWGKKSGFICKKKNFTSHHMKKQTITFKQFSSN